MVTGIDVKITEHSGFAPFKKEVTDSISRSAIDRYKFSSITYNDCFWIFFVWLSMMRVYDGSLIKLPDHEIPSLASNVNNAIATQVAIFMTRGDIDRFVVGIKLAMMHHWKTHGKAQEDKVVDFLRRNHFNVTR
jgi:hypothetical protein